MHFLTIYHVKSGIYSSRDATLDELSLLGDFLTTSVGWQADVKKYLSSSPESDYNAGMCLAERYNDIVTISHWYDKGLPEFTVPYDKLMKLIDDWLEACNKLPNEIIITMDDQFNFTVTSKHIK